MLIRQKIQNNEDRRQQKCKITTKHICLKQLYNIQGSFSLRLLPNQCRKIEMFCRMGDYSICFGKLSLRVFKFLAFYFPRAYNPWYELKINQTNQPTNQPTNQEKHKQPDYPELNHKWKSFLPMASQSSSLENDSTVSQLFKNKFSSWSQFLVGIKLLPCYQFTLLLKIFSSQICNTKKRKRKGREIVFK